MNSPATTMPALTHNEYMFLLLATLHAGDLAYISLAPTGQTFTGATATWTSSIGRVHAKPK